MFKHMIKMYKHITFEFTFITIVIENIFIFSKQAFNESLDFATVHSLMNDINLIDSCQAHLPVQYHLPEVTLVL